MAHVAQPRSSSRGSGTWGGEGWGSNSTRHDATRLDSTQSRRRRRRHRGYNLYPTIHLANTLTRNPPPPLPPLSTSPTLGLSPVSARQMKVATIARVAQATRNMPRLKCKVCIASIFRQACRVRERERGRGQVEKGWLTRGHESHVRS